jgi:hypothetical protein
VISDVGAVIRRTVGGADIRLGSTSFSVSTSVVSASNTSSSVRAGVVGTEENSDCAKEIECDEGVVAAETQRSTFWNRSGGEQFSFAM